MEIPEDILSAAVAVVDRGYDTGLIDAVAAALMAERKRGEAALAEADRHAAKLEALLEPHIKWDAAIRTPSTGEEQ